MNKFKLFGCALAFACSSTAYAKSTDTFYSSIAPISPALKQLMTGKTWHSGCPVGFDKLAYVKVSYWGFDDKAHIGELVVNKRIADEIVQIFHELYQAKFPIERMELADRFKDADERGAANDTYAFNCRHDDQVPTLLSTHSYGIAIDINQFYNPAKVDGKADPKGSEKYFDRNLQHKGMITTDSIAFKIFTKYGWRWAGLNPAESVDYQHLQKVISKHYRVDKMSYYEDLALP